MADLHVWLDGKEDDELSCSWTTQIQFDFDRFQADDHYAHLVSKYIQEALEHLADEVEEIGVAHPKGVSTATASRDTPAHLLKERHASIN